jgi:hypothetical protein
MAARRESTNAPRLGASRRGVRRARRARLTRPGAKTVWPYRLAGSDLELQENGEIHRYRRLRAFSCRG